ncbi:MAG: ABC transporter permease [Armatimonadota bacterium]|nr:ABC transporter permease [Armatimonadota bacterium]
MKKPFRYNLGRIMQIRELPALVFLLLAVVFLWNKAPNFGEHANLLSIARETSIVGIMAVGMTAVILTGGIDLSVASVLALSASVIAILAVNGSNLLIAILAGLGIGTACGALNGLLITFLRIPPIITTLGTMAIYRAAVTLFTQAKWIGPLPAGMAFIGSKITPAFILFLIATITSLFLWKCRLGRYIQAIGGNENAVHLSGISVRKVKLLVYMLNGFLATVAGLVMASSANSAQANMALGYELNVIAAVVIGGTSISGGQGSVIGSVLGAAIMSVLYSALILLDASIYWHKLILGGVILAAVLLDKFRYLTKQ